MDRLLIALLAALTLTAGTALADGKQPRPETRAQFTPPPAKEGYSYPDCYCTDSDGRRVEMGQRACLTIGRRQVMARCGMSLNNPTWRTESEGCVGV